MVSGCSGRFQSTRPRGARRVGIVSRIPRHYRFNPRAHAGRDLVAFSASCSTCAFQSTRPRGARRVGIVSRIPRHYRFNPRAHAGRDLVAFSASCSTCAFQSTRPRGARRLPGTCRACTASVSIHAPTRGATDLQRGDAAAAGVSIHAPTRGATIPPKELQKLKTVSIHAPTRGATVLRSASSSEVLMFQSTRPRGARPTGRQRFVPAQQVSIHAPTRGATPCWLGSERQLCFNPRAHAGRDNHDNADDAYHLQFQSTRPRRARQYCALW